MNKLMIMSLLVMAVWFMGFTQTTIPIPPGLSNWAILESSEAIGDFDGDGSNDVSAWWVDSTKGYTYSNWFSVYSFKKNTHLLIIVGDNRPGLLYKYAADLNNDGKVEIMIRNKIYSFSTTDTKKKLP